MNEALRVVLASFAGMAIGAFFFGGLWWTVHHGAAAKRPAVWFLGSMLLRTAVAMSGFYLVAGGQSGRLLPCLLGFLSAQIAVTRLTRASTTRDGRPEREVSRAP
jgi:F1F0 ATPase subunit 2